MKAKLLIELKDWEHTCGDGCCYSYGVEIYVNNEKIEEQGLFLENSIEAILKHLGYNVEVIRS